VHEVQLCVSLFYVSLHRAVLHVHCHLFFMFHYTEQYFMYIATSFFMFHYTQLVKYENEVKIYMKYSSVCSEI
jgi:hypothetical protein